MQAVFDVTIPVACRTSNIASDRASNSARKRGHSLADGRVGNDGGRGFNGEGRHAAGLEAALQDDVGVVGQGSSSGSALGHGVVGHGVG